MAGEFAFDENMAELKDFLKMLNATSARRLDDGTEGSTKADGVYSLLHMSVIYGTLAYLSGEFGKEDRIDHNRVVGLAFADAPKGTRRAMKKPGTFYEYNDVRVNRLA